jgi:potassium efflux system protein
MLLFAAGLCLIWSDVFPALRFLNDVQVWGGGDNPVVSLANVLEAAIVAVMTIVAAANLPGLIEMLVLARLPLDNGVRYAIIAVVRYAIAILGLGLAGGAVGIGGTTALLTIGSGWLYAHFGPAGFLAMAGLCLAALPAIWSLQQVLPASEP